MGIGALIASIGAEFASLGAGVAAGLGIEGSLGVGALTTGGLIGGALEGATFGGVLGGGIAAVEGKPILPALGLGAAGGG